MRLPASSPVKHVLRLLILVTLAFLPRCRPSQVVPQIPPSESFMLVYVDRASPAERIHVRFSNDRGQTWSLGDPQTATAGDGVGAATSEDNVGLMRVIVHDGNISRFHFRFGLGPAVWDATDQRPTPPPSQRGVPQITYGGSPGWLVTNLGGGSGFVPSVLRYSSSTRTFTDVSPSAAQLSLGALNVLAAPAITSRGGRVVVAYLRHNGIGNTATLADLQTLSGTVGPGLTVTWSNATTFTLSEPGFGPPISRPALGHDNRQFLLGVVRPATTSGGAPRLFIYGSPDGQSWTPVGTFDQLPTQPPDQLNVSLAGTSDGTLVVMLTAAGVAKLHRFTGSSGWSEVPAGNVFGSELPNWFLTALVTAGRPPP
jgi:hypothetical protein